MQYQGKLAGMVLLLANTVIWFFYGRYLKTPPVLDIVLLVCTGLIGYWFGFLYDRVKITSLRDELTQVYNRRIIHKHIPDLLERAARRNCCLSVTIVDCDNFKNINDKHGHAAGDNVLRNISTILVQNVRRNDLIVRWGGDEFLVIAENSDPSSARSIQDRINTQLEELSAIMNIKLSVSVGTAMYPADADDILDLIEIADQNLYHYKHTKKELASKEL